MYIDQINEEEPTAVMSLFEYNRLVKERNKLREALVRSHAQLKEYQRFAGQSAAYDDLLNQNEQALSRSTENPNV